LPGRHDGGYHENREKKKDCGHCSRAGARSVRVRAAATVGTTVASELAGSSNMGQ
jgi:hypothetical protein